MSALRIGMAAPWNTRSAIAQSASEIAFELVKRGHSLTVLRTEVGACLDLPVRLAPGAVRHISEYQDHELRRDFDIIIGHFGDHYGFHGALLPRLDSVEIMGVIHDACVPHLMRDWRNDDQFLLRDMVRETYVGTSATELPFYWNDFFYVSKNHPMIEWIASRLVGVVAHARHYATRLEKACPGPVAVIPLAFEVPDLPTPPHPSDTILIASVGHANHNKRIDQLILAISGSYLLRKKCLIRVIGEASQEARERLTKLSQDLGISTPEFTGWVSDEELRVHLKDVDVISCLRNPVIEGASASLILGLLSGRPVLATNHGSYAEVPTDSALLCDPHYEALDILLHLERIARDPSYGTAVGARGQTFAAVRHTAVAYVDALEPLLQSCVMARPIRAAKRSLENTLTDFGLSKQDDAVLRMMALMDDMTSEHVSAKLAKN